MDAPLRDGLAATAAPEAADLPRALYGEFGVLATDGTRVECCLCARWFVLLAGHVRQAHGLTPAEYRVLAGLNAQTALAGPRLRARRRALAEETLRPYRERVGELGRSHTPEERAARMLGRRRRAEARLAARAPERKAREAEGHRQTVATRRARYGDAYQTVPGGFADRQAAARASQRGLAARRERLRDPAYREAVGRHISEGKGGRVEVICAVCGGAFRVPPSWIVHQQARICRPACREQWRLSRRKAPGGLAYAEAAARLQQLEAADPGALDRALPAPEAAAVRLAYGLGEDAPLALRAVAGRTGLPLRRVARLVAGPVVGGLIGPPDPSA